MFDKLWMAKALSEDLRKRIVRKREEGYSEADISQMFSVSTSSVYRFCKRHLELGHVRPAKMGQPEGSKLDPHRESLCGWVKEQPGLTLEELTELCARELNIHVHHTTVMRALSKWGYRYKKNSLRQGTESA